MLIPAYIIAAAIPALVLYIIYSRDLYKTGAFRFVALCFFAGAAAFLLCTLLVLPLQDRNARVTA